MTGGISFSPNGVGFGSTTNAAVTIDASGDTDAAALPRGNTAQRPSGNDGYIRYNTDENAFEGYSDGSWIEFGSSSVAFYQNGRLILQTTNVNFVNTSSVTANLTANGTQLNVAFVSTGGGGGGNYEVDVYANGTLVLANANLNFNNTTTMNVNVVANGTTQANINISANLTAIGIPAIEAALGDANAAISAANSAIAAANAAISTLNTYTGTVNSTFGTINTNITTALTVAEDAYAAANEAYAKANAALVNTQIASGNTSNIAVIQEANGQVQIDTRLATGGGSGGNVINDYWVNNYAVGTQTGSNTQFTYYAVPNIGRGLVSLFNIAANQNGSQYDLQVSGSPNSNGTLFLAANGIQSNVYELSYPWYYQPDQAGDQNLYIGLRQDTNYTLGWTLLNLRIEQFVPNANLVQVGTFLANSSLVIGNANLNFINTATVNVVAASDVAANQANVGFTVNVSAVEAALAIVPGANQQVLFNNNSVFGANAGLLFNVANQTLVTTNVSAGNLVISSNATFGNLVTGNINVGQNLTLSNLVLTQNLVGSLNVTTNIAVGGIATVNGNASFGTAVNTNCVVTLGNSTPAWNQFTVVQCGPYGWIAGYPSDTNGMYIGYNCYWNGSSWTSIADVAAAFVEASYIGINGYTAPANTPGGASELQLAFTANAQNTTTRCWIPPNVQSMSFCTGWTNSDPSAYQSGRWWIDPNGVVHLGGLVGGTTAANNIGSGANSNIATLPAVCYPSNGACIIQALGYNGNSSGRVEGVYLNIVQNSNGTANIYFNQFVSSASGNINNSGWICLDGLSYPTF